MKEERKSTKKITPREKKAKSCHPVPLISLRVEEEELLVSLVENNNFRINPYSDSRKIARSTTRSRLKKLDRLGLIIYDSKRLRLGTLENGRLYVEKLKEKTGVESSRAEGRKDALSSHWHYFSSKIKNRMMFTTDKLYRLGVPWKRNQMNNWEEFIVYFSDATVTIKPKTLVINLKDLVKNDTKETDAICLRRLIEYIEMFHSIGIETEELVLERGHWERIDSVLAHWIYKKLGEKYHLKLSNGKDFYIDFSPDGKGVRHVNHEVTDKIMMENLDHNMTQQLEKKFDFEKIDINYMDISEIKESLGIVLKNFEKINEIEKSKIEYEIMKKKLELKEPIKLNTEIRIIPSYVN